MGKQIITVGAGEWFQKVFQHLDTEIAAVVDPGDIDVEGDFERFSTHEQLLQNGSLDPDGIFLMNIPSKQADQADKLARQYDCPILYNKTLGAARGDFPDVEADLLPLAHYHKKEAVREAVDLVRDQELRIDEAEFHAYEESFSEEREHVVMPENGGIAMDWYSHVLEFAVSNLESRPELDRENLYSFKTVKDSSREAWKEHPTAFYGEASLEGSEIVKPGATLKFGFGKNFGEENKLFRLSGEGWELEGYFETESEGASISYTGPGGPITEDLQKSVSDSSKHRLAQDAYQALETGEVELDENFGKMLLEQSAELRENAFEVEIL